MPSPHQHEAFQVYELSIDNGIEPEVLLERLRNLRMLRAKGFVQTSLGLRLLQGVGRRLELTEASAAPPAALIGRIVVVARKAEHETHDG